MTLACASAVADASPTPYNVRHGITQCVRLMTPMAEQKKLELTLDFADDVPSNLVIDGLRMRQILLNLVGNAVKFTTSGSVAVRVSRAAGRGGDVALHIAVSDTGVGVPGDRLATIFDPFVQAEASTTRRFGGSGLGLSISRSLAEMMGGAIRAESVVGQGTSMTLVLPWVDVAQARPKKDKAGSIAASALRRPDRRGASILLIEDVEINRELFSEMLNELGHRFDLGEDGAQACELARELDDEPAKWDLILMDLQMPVMDGLAATRAIRAHGGRAATIPIIALTASAFEDEVRDCHSAGMNDHLAKPVSIDGLRMIIDRWRGDAPGKTPHVIPASPHGASLDDKFVAKRHETRDRFAQIVAELGAAGPQQQVSLIGEAQQLAHFLAGCAGMFGERALGDIASATEHQLASAGSGSRANAATRSALQALIDALDEPRSDAAEAPRHSRRA